MELTHSPILDLAAELRLEIYDYVIPQVPLSVPRSQYAGLVYACRQMKMEVEPLVVKRMQRILTVIAAEAAEGWDDDLTFSQVDTVSDVKNIAVGGRFNFEPATESRRSRRDHPLLNLLDMHLDSLRVKMTYVQVKSELYQRERLWSRWLLHRFTRRADQPNTPRVKAFRLEWRGTPMCAWRMLRPFTNGWKERVRARGVWSMRELIWLSLHLSDFKGLGCHRVPPSR
jgi:hypothetical protein